MGVTMRGTPAAMAVRSDALDPSFDPAIGSATMSHSASRSRESASGRKAMCHSIASARPDASARARQAAISAIRHPLMDGPR
jgi:hypothetical protein